MARIRARVSRLSRMDGIDALTDALTGLWLATLLMGLLLLPSLML
jgi:hypothetical protein